MAQEKTKNHKVDQGKKAAKPKCVPGTIYDSKLNKCISVTKKRKGESLIELRQRETRRKQKGAPLPS